MGWMRLFRLVEWFGFLQNLIFVEHLNDCTSKPVPQKKRKRYILTKP